jgi:hypothetical protein
MRATRLPTLVIALIVCIACGGDSPSPTAPTPPPPAQIAGSWSGTFESSNYQALAAFMNLNQTGTTISGTWGAPSGNNAVAGNVTGTVDTSTFTGTITFSFNQTAGCSGSFSGSVSATAITLTSPGFTGNCGLSSPGNPLTPRFVLQRR